MSRIGKLPVKIPEKVKVAVSGTTVKIEGPKGKMSFPFNPAVKVEVAGNEVKVTRPDESRLAKGLHGLTRTLVRNALDGVTKGYERTLEISGVGFKAELKGKAINFTLGFSHPVVFALPEGVTAEVDPKQTKVTIKGVDHHAVTQLFIERQLLQQNAQVFLVAACKLEAFAHERTQKVAESFVLRIGDASDAADRERHNRRRQYRKDNLLQQGGLAFEVFKNQPFGDPRAFGDRLRR